MRLSFFLDFLNSLAFLGVEVFLGCAKTKAYTSLNDVFAPMVCITYLEEATNDLTFSLCLTNDCQSSSRLDCPEECLSSCFSLI